MTLAVCNFWLFHLPSQKSGIRWSHQDTGPEGKRPHFFPPCPPFFSVSAWFCLFHGQIKDSREWSLAKDLSASSAWHAKYWAHQVSKRWEDTSTSLFMDGKLPAPPLWGSRGRNSCYICFQSPMRPTVPLGWKRPIILQLHQIKLPVAYS